MTITPERLAAYADGELHDQEAREVEAAIAEDPALKDELEAHLALKARLFAHFAPIAEQPVPDRLRRAVLPETAEVVDIFSARKRRDSNKKRWTWIAGPALAASLALVFLNFGIRQTPDETHAGGALALALDNQLAATQGTEAPVRILLSFRDAGGRFCRGYASRSESGIACHETKGWRLEKRFGGTGRASTEYRQAGSNVADVLAAAQDMAHGPALDAAGEAAAAAQGWR